MNLPHRITRCVVFLACLAWGQSLPAEEAAFSPEVQRRLDVLKAGYDAYVLTNCTAPYQTSLKALNEKVKPVLERDSDAMAQKKDLDGLVRVKADIERIGKGQVLTEAAEPPPEALKNAYAAYRLELAKVDAAKKAVMADASRRYDSALAQLQDELTTSKQVAAALEVKKLRESLAPAAAAAAAATTTPAVTVAATPATTAPPAIGAPATAKRGDADDNLLDNGSFYKGTLKWEMTTHESSANPKYVVDRKVLFHDKATLRVVNPIRTDTHIRQKVKVKPNTRYRIAGFIKAQDIKDSSGPVKPGSAGACITIDGSGGYTSPRVSVDTWTEVSGEFKTQNETERIFECRLGYYGSTVSGTAWFAELSMTEVK